MQRIKETKKVWELDRIKNIAKDIMDDKEWVNDSHSKSEHKGIVDGLSRLINHMELAEKYDEFCYPTSLPKDYFENKKLINGFWYVKMSDL
tara:strand:- start:2631 stop:2903 length:273 start_codon:yes stop_codon:yes gene_type:complete